MPAKNVIIDINAMVIMGALLTAAKVLLMIVMPPNILMASANTAAPIRILTTFANEFPIAFITTLKSLVTSFLSLRLTNSRINTKNSPSKFAVTTSRLMDGIKLNTVIKTMGIMGSIA